MQRGKGLAETQKVNERIAAWMHREERGRRETRRKEGNETPRVTRPTLRNKNSLYGQLLLRPPRFFCIPFVPRHSGFQSVQRIHSLPMVSSGIPRFPFLSLSLPSFLLLSFLPSDNFFHSLLLLLSLALYSLRSCCRCSLALYSFVVVIYIYIYLTGKLERERECVLKRSRTPPPFFDFILRAFLTHRMEVTRIPGLFEAIKSY